MPRCWCGRCTARWGESRAGPRRRAGSTARGPAGRLVLVRPGHTARRREFRMPQDRPFDLTLYGATGFTGTLTAEYLARNAPAGCRWAIAGRDDKKLAALRDRLAVINPDC